MVIPGSSMSAVVVHAYWSLRAGGLTLTAWEVAKSLARDAMTERLEKCWKCILKFLR
jgi:hypothetical protein